MGIMTIILPDTVNNLVSKRITDLMRNNLKRKARHKYCKLQFLANDVYLFRTHNLLPCSQY